MSYHQGLAQFCWAHLQRTLKGIGEGAATADAVHFARDMLSAVDRLFALWYRFRGEAGAGKRLLSRKRGCGVISSTLSNFGRASWGGVTLSKCTNGS